MRSPTLALLALAALVTAGAAVACSAPAASDSEVSEGELTGAVRKGDEFLRCWTVSDGNTSEFFRSYALTCRVSSKGLPGLAGTSVFVDAHGASGRVVTGRPGESVDQDVVLGNMTKSDFPLKLHVYGTWAKERTDSTSAFRIDVPAAESANASAPVVVKLPFDTWPVTFLNRLPLAVVSTGRYDVQAAPFFTEQDERSTKTTFSTSASTGFVREPRVSLDLIAPPSGGIDVNIQGPHTPLHATIATPGVYVIEESGLRLATAAEEAELGPAPEPAPGPGASDAGPAPVDAAPAATCGDPGQMHCTASTGSWSCNAGTRADTSSGTCLACGNDGQTYCVIDPRNISGNWQCNAGTRLESSTNECVACGSVGKTHCVADPRNISGNWTCNAGLRLDTSSGLCVM
jgi:hypothetical protein